jgi:hypothetical protein
MKTQCSSCGDLYDSSQGRHDCEGKLRAAIVKAREELARHLQTPHPELQTCLHSDKGATDIAAAIDRLIEARLAAFWAAR